jgi:hypothetical protein
VDEARYGGTRTATRVGIAAAALAAVVLAAAPGAAIAKKAKVVTETATAGSAGLPEFGVVTATATCAKKQKLVGGGFDGDANADGGLVPLESRAEGKRAWVVRALKGGEGEPSLDVYAYCRKGAPKLKQRSASVLVPGVDGGPGPETAASATCPKKAKALAGGFALTAQREAGGELIPTLALSSVRSAKRTWTASAQVPDGEQSQQLTVYAYCAKKKRSEVSASGQIATPNPDTSTLGSVLSPACEKGTSLAGGFDVDPFGERSLLVTVGSFRSGDQWVTRALQGIATGTVVTRAYCG